MGLEKELKIKIGLINTIMGNIDPIGCTFKLNDIETMSGKINHCEELKRLLKKDIERLEEEKNKLKNEPSSIRSYITLTSIQKTLIQLSEIERLLSDTLIILNDMEDE